MATGRRRFGRVRRLPSGRWQARYLGPDGCDRPAAQTFETRRDADRWLSAAETDLGRGHWVDPSASQTTVEAWSGIWLANRPDPKVRTRELYDWLLGKYIVPRLGHVPLGKVTPSLVRSWHAQISRVGSPTPVRQSYSLLRAMLTTASPPTSSCAIHARSRALASATRPSGRSRPSRRYSLSLKRSRRDIRHSSSPPPGQVRGGAS